MNSPEQPKIGGNQKMANEKQPEFLNKFSPEVREIFNNLSWMDTAEAMKKLAENIASRGDFTTAEEIVNQIKNPIRERPKDAGHLYWGKVDGLVSLVIAEYKQGQQERANKRISDTVSQINELPVYNRDSNLTLVARFFVETDQTEKAREIIDQIGIDRDPNTVWRVVEHLAKHELDKGNYETVLSLEDLLKYDTYKINLRVMIARNIGHQFPEKATEILQDAEKLAAKDKRSPDSRINRAWAFMGQLKAEDPISTIELAKHFFTIGDPEKAESLLRKAMSGPRTQRFSFDELTPAEIQLETGKAYLLAEDPGHEKTKKYLNLALQSLASAEYSGQYLEEAAYAKNDVYKRIEEVLIEVGDLEELRRLLKDKFIESTASTHRIRMDILTVLLNHTHAD